MWAGEGYVGSFPETYNDPLFFALGQMTLKLRSLFSLEIHVRNNRSKHGSKRT